MIEIINKVNREDLESLLVNKGQNEVGEAMLLFANQVPEINVIEDLEILDKLFYSYFKSDKNTKKFACTSEEIFERKTFSGCSDIGLAISAILRMKGIPTIYVESAKIEWIGYVHKNDVRQEFMQGHIFLEIYLNDKWYLYDPTFHLVYDNYDYMNFFLPRGYYAFAKALNCHEFDVHSVADEKKVGKEVIKDFAISAYKEPNYSVVDLRNIDKGMKKIH